MILVWKIRQKSTGLFSTGGMSPRFTREGKVWSRKCDVSNHIAQFITGNGSAIVANAFSSYPIGDDYEVICYSLETMYNKPLLYAAEELALQRHVKYQKTIDKFKKEGAL